MKELLRALWGDLVMLHQHLEGELNIPVFTTRVGLDFASLTVRDIAFGDRALQQCS